MTKTSGQSGIKGIRAAFADAKAAPAPTVAGDPSPYDKREGHGPGQWPGAPMEKLPPDCPVTPLGVNGHYSFYVDGLGQLLDFDGLDKKKLIKLFRLTPNYISWAWPRFSEPKGGKPSMINGVDVDDAIGCLEKAAAMRGLFDPAGRVRGRGAWTDSYGRLIWHNGDALWTVDGAKMKVARTGELDGIFYPRRPGITEPWREPVSIEESPARRIFQDLKSWNWERPELDPVLMLGGIGVMMLSGALPWRSHLALMGDWGTGKSALNGKEGLIKKLLGSILIDAANATEAGIRQHMGLDALPVSIDEFEASDDNRRAVAIIELARIACSGGRLLRGGQDHKGVEFQARNAFCCSGILMPPMKAQDRSRFGILNLGKLHVGDKGPPEVQSDDGRLLLRSLMDQWADQARAYGDWRSILRAADLDGRAQDTYGTLLSMAEMMLGQTALIEAGMPIDDAARMGELIRAATAEERGMQVDNWRECLEHLLDKPINAWKGGEKPTIGGTIEQLEAGKMEFGYARDRLAAAGCGIIEEPDPAIAAGQRRYLLAVPVRSPALAELFLGTRWSDGGWGGALRQARGAGVVRGDDKNVKINRRQVWCRIVDLKIYDESERR